MKKILIMSLLIIYSSMFLSCVTPMQRLPLSKESAAKINGKTCEISKPKTPDFYAQTTEKAWLPPMIGIAASFSAGRDIVEQNDVEDPAIFVSSELEKLLTVKFNLKFLPKSEIISESNDVDTLCKAYSKGDLLLDVRTVGWAFGTGEGSVPAFSTQYLVSLIINLKVIDLKAKEALSEEVFVYPIKGSDDANRTFSYDELMNNNADGLKKELKRAADKAVIFFKEKTFIL